MMGRLFGLALLVIALMLAMEIGADFASYQAERSVHIAVVADDQELIDLDPQQPYAYLGDDGKLYIDISENHPDYQSNYQGLGKGISPDSVYAFNCMFNVSNHLWDGTTIKVTVTSSDTRVKVYTNNPATADGTVEFNVAPEGSVCVGMEFNAGGLVENDTIEGVLTIHAEPVQ
jgi:hypothetical protein